MEEHPDNSDHEESSPLSSAVSRASDYSSDLFESCSNDSSFKYESETFESLSAESVHISQFETASTQSRSSEDTSQEQCIDEGLIEKWIDTLKGYGSRTNAHQSGCSSKKRPPPDDNIVHGITTMEESNALVAFCTRKLRQIQNPPVKLHQNQSRSATNLRRPVLGDPQGPVPIQLFNRIRLQNTKESAKQLMQIEMHQPSACPDCCAVQAELAKNTFLRMKKTKLESHLLENKIQDVIYSKDIVTLIGEIHQSLPRLSDESNIIWQKLLCSDTRTLEEPIISQSVTAQSLTG
uniref:Uncharacterized protein n=1 Tax=Leptobrachium leishanense TaxID=445787 RepID=A0A8C5PND1_9ANUR